jgi:predicted  nucleic acid-binding Zn-ribbon protein
MEQLTPEILKELETLRAWKQKMSLNPERQSLGCKLVGNRLHTCPNCGREIKGNSGFGQHVKKCNKSLDK